MREQREYVVPDGCAARLAGAARTYRLRRPSFVVPVVAEVIVGMVALVIGPIWLGVVFLVLAVLLPLALFGQARALAAALGAAAFRPGTVLGASWDVREFAITAGDDQALHGYEEVRDFAEIDGVAVLRLHGDRLLLLLPLEVVPDAGRARLRGAEPPSGDPSGDPSE